MKLEKCITETNVNQNMLNIKYAVRGPILERAIQIERELEKGVKKPFERVVRANIGDCHALGQPPITFIRQVLALAACPALASSPDVPDDVKQRVKELLEDCTKGSVGSYSPSNGLNLVRRSVAEYLEARDGVAASLEDVYLGSGASDVIKAVLSLFVQDVDGKPPAVMIPIPQYPLFSGTLSELGLRQANYYLDEDNDWAIQVQELERSWREASRQCHVRALVVINPGNPTGQVLARENMEEIIKFAYDHELFILADEVYQENIISKPFHSFKKMKPPAPGEASHAGFRREAQAARRRLAARARSAHRVFNSIPGLSCNAIDGAMFAFPRIEIPERAQVAAAEAGLQPDEFYCLRLLEETGVCVVPGSGFGQRPGSFHFRTTILHPRAEFQYMLESVRRFHAAFRQSYS
ncbi:jg19069 [Pararge aegeria aegeria]|uniref:alanine transaminase n=1 Tax=Pararge aegeria aegeria TaxID=348720 RepID=A0A8S4SJP3_9NEOP|nr:jg19069 [Pararge aegeria aegeria]